MAEPQAPEVIVWEMARRHEVEELVLPAMCHNYRCRVLSRAAVSVDDGVMTKRKQERRPTWDGIKNYVEGQLVRERRRFEKQLTKLLDVERRARTEQFVLLDKLLERTAIEVRTYGDQIDDQDKQHGA